MIDSTVLYADHQGHLAPLSWSYFARKLSSCVDAVPPSTVTEIDSAFCPQCLHFYDTATASSNRGRCPRPHCKQCPVCSCPLTLGIEESSKTKENFVCVFKCGYCRWTSEECGVASKIDFLKSADAKVAIEAATEKLILKSKMRSEKKAVQLNSKDEISRDLFFQKLVDGWGDLAQEHERRRRHGNTYKMPSEKNSKPLHVLSNFVLLEKTEVPKKDFLSVPSSDELIAQGVRQLSSLNKIEDLVPLSIPLQARKSRRCRHELASGRPGILVKPKVNPVEGDSSLRSGHGQWWKKDSSAIHVVPRVKLLQFGKTGNHKKFQTALLLKVENPTLSQVNIRFKGCGNIKKTTTNDKEEHYIDRLVIDHMKRTYVDAVIVGATNNANTSELTQLDAVEDAFLELGKKQSNSPIEVSSWTPASALNKIDESNDKEAHFSIVAHQDDSAWFQVLFSDAGSSESTKTSHKLCLHCALPISMQIEIGNGSWESSLLTSSKGGEGDDFASFDMLVVWKNASN
uniref:Dynactin subunit 4 n=1 Tax=Proboscia inermis TaxID=420281 RepID=A0A7S0G9X7_9STRA